MPQRAKGDMVAQLVEGAMTYLRTVERKSRYRVEWSVVGGKNGLSKRHIRKHTSGDYITGEIWFC